MAKAQRKHDAPPRRDAESEACYRAMALLRNRPRDQAMRVFEWRTAGLSWIAVLAELLLLN